MVLKEKDSSSKNNKMKHGDRYEIDCLMCGRHMKFVYKGKGKKRKVCPRCSAISGCRLVNLKGKEREEMEEFYLGLLKEVRKRKMLLCNQVCSLEHAKKLKELGVKQESVWRWIQTDNKHDGSLSLNILYDLSSNIMFVDPKKGDIYAAFTVAELGEILPEVIMGQYVLCFDKYDNNHWGISYVSRDGEMCEIDVEGISEAEIRAKMVISLIEIGEIKTKGEDER